MRTSAGRAGPVAERRRRAASAAARAPRRRARPAAPLHRTTSKILSSPSSSTAKIRSPSTTNRWTGRGRTMTARRRPSPSMTDISRPGPRSLPVDGRGRREIEEAPVEGRGPAETEETLLPALEGQVHGPRGVALVDGDLPERGRRSRRSGGSVRSPLRKTTKKSPPSPGQARIMFRKASYIGSPEEPASSAFPAQAAGARRRCGAIASPFRFPVGLPVTRTRPPARARTLSGRKGTANAPARPPVAVEDLDPGVELVRDKDPVPGRPRRPRGRRARRDRGPLRPNARRNRPSFEKTLTAQSWASATKRAPPPRARARGRPGTASSSAFSGPGDLDRLRRLTAPSSAPAAAAPRASASAASDRLVPPAPLTPAPAVRPSPVTAPACTCRTRCRRP